MSKFDRNNRYLNDFSCSKYYFLVLFFYNNVKVKFHKLHSVKLKEFLDSTVLIANIDRQTGQKGRTDHGRTKLLIIKVKDDRSRRRRRKIIRRGPFIIISQRISSFIV